VFTKINNLNSKQVYLWLLILTLLVLIFFSSPKNWWHFFFLDHDYPFDFYDWKSLYINQSNGRISTLALIGLLPNVIASQMVGSAVPFFQSFVIKIIPLIFFFYIFAKKITEWFIDEVCTWQDYLFISLAIFLVFFGLTGQMFFSAGIFYSFIIQLNFCLFLLHLCAYFRNPVLIYQEKYIYLAAAVIQTSIISGSTVIPMSLYFSILYFGSYKKVLNLKRILIIVLLILSALTIFILSRYQNISLDTGLDELNTRIINKGYENITGGYFYQFIGFSNWGIYTGWPDRLIGGFVKYFDKPQYQIALFLLNSAALYWLLKNSLYRLSMIVLCFLIFSVGSQPPLGFIFIWLVEHIPGFESIRTPDNKFGFYTQAILISALIKSWTWYSKNIKKLLLFALVLVSIFNLYPIFLGKVLFGYSSQFSPNSTFILNIEYEKSLISKLQKDDFIMSIPGYGVFDHPSGRVGLIDPIYSLHSKVISYSTAIADPKSSYFIALNSGNLSGLKDVNAIIARKPHHNVLDRAQLSAAGFNNVYEDQYTIIYKSTLKAGELQFEDYWLWWISVGCLILYSTLIYFIFQYIFRLKNIQDA
jgi:hypothetical protein